MNQHPQPGQTRPMPDEVHATDPIDPEAFRKAVEDGFPEYPYSSGMTSRTRFRLFERLVGAVGLRDDAKMLSVGCGPLALEVLSDLARRCDVTAFDYTPEFQGVYDKLRERGMLKKVAFSVGDARMAEFEPDSYDIVVFHDIFYETALDAPEIVARFVPAVKPGGLVYFDLMDERAHRVWKLIGAELPEYRRYNIDRALARVREAGLEIIAQAPTDENRDGLKRATITLIRKTTGIANAFGILARRPART